MNRRGWLVTSLAAGVCAAGLMAERPGYAQPISETESPLLQAPDANRSDAPPARPEPPPSPDGASQPGLEAASEEEAFTSLDSGPIHEAFAEPITLNAEPDVVVSQQPPEPVPELPPETRPEGDNVLWIPGYWAWSDDSEDFIWVSGVWRDAPPNQEWVPGYWTETDGGHQWVHGFWTTSSPDQLAYLPAPPESLETQPTAPQPGPDYFWVPGCWRWYEGQYAWRAGFWHPAQQNWLWVPAHYHYTPRGYVYLNGYWDYPLARRGLLFAPVRFFRPIYRRPGFFYTPRSWINISLLTRGLFVAPRRGHYFYGNFYGSRFAARGYYPWYQYHNRRFGYDPLFAFDSWRYGGRNSQWYRDLDRDYRRYADRDFAGRGPNRGPFDDGPGRGGPDRDRFDDDRFDDNRGPNRGRGPGGFDGDRGPDGRDGGRGPGGFDRDQPRFVNNLSDLDSDRVTRIDDSARRQAVERAENRFGDFRKQRVEMEARGRGNFPGRDSGLTDGARDGRNIGRGEGINPSGRDLDRSNRGRFDQPRADQARSDRPNTNQPRVDRPDVRQPRGDRPELGRSQPGLDRGPTNRSVGRPVGPPSGRSDGPQAEQRNFSNRGESGRGNVPDIRGRSFTPQTPRNSGNFNPGGRNPGASGIPQNRAPQNRGGSPSFGNRGGSPSFGNRGGSPSPGSRGGGSPSFGNRGGGSPSFDNRGSGGRPSGNRGGGGPSFGNRGGGGSPANRGGGFSGGSRGGGGSSKGGRGRGR